MYSTLSIRSANWLALFTFALVFTLGTLVQLWNLSYGLLITEIVLILVPVLLWLRARRLPIRETLRLKRIPFWVIIVCVVIGVTIWLPSSMIQGLMTTLTDVQYREVIPPDLLPDTLAENIAYLLALVVLAPLAEEILFRGVLQGAYQRRFSPLNAIVFIALLFAFYHLRLTGTAALIPVSLMLGYVVWRTGSLYAGMAVHFGYNLVGGTVSMLVNANPEFQSRVASGTESTELALIGGIAIVAMLASFVLLVLGVLLITLKVRAPGSLVAEPQPEPAPDQASAGRSPWLAYIPLILVAVIWFGVTLWSLTAVQGQPLSADAFQPVVQSPDGELRYRILNHAGDDVGSVTCTQSAAGGTIVLSCTKQVEAYDVEVGSSRWISGNDDTTWRAEWDADTLTLTEFAWEQSVDGKAVAEAGYDGTALSYSSSNQTHAAQTDGYTLLQQEWPFRMVFLDPSISGPWKVSYGGLGVWDEGYGEAVVEVTSLTLTRLPEESVSVPAGDFTAVKFTLGEDEAAWYANDLLVQFEDRFHTYQLED